MKILIIGANGKIGKRLTKRLTEVEDFEPTAFIRKEEQRSYFESRGIGTLIEDLEHSEDTLAEALAGFDTVVFAAGSGASTGFDKTMEIDLYGAVKSIQAAQSKGVQRFVMISAAKAGAEEDWPEGMRPYYIAKHLADEALKRSSLDYTILRPVRLTDAEEAGKIQIASRPDALQGEIPREAVAASVVAVLKDQGSIGKVMEMSAGDEDIDSAVRNFTSD